MAFRSCCEAGDIDVGKRPAGASRGRKRRLRRRCAPCCSHPVVFVGKAIFFLSATRGILYSGPRQVGYCVDAYLVPKHNQGQPRGLPLVPLAYRSRLVHLRASNGDEESSRSPTVEYLRALNVGSGEENRTSTVERVKSGGKVVETEEEDAQKPKNGIERRGQPRPKIVAKRKTFRMTLFATLNLPIVEVLAASAVLLSSFLVALGTLNDLPPEAIAAIDDALLALNVIFAIDFFVRWYAAGQFKPIYLTKPLAVIDIFVVILPFVLGGIFPLLDKLGVKVDGSDAFVYGMQNSSGLQNLLLLRVLRLRRILTDINTFRKFFATLGLKPQNVRPYQLELARVLLSVFTLVSVASGLIYAAEHDVNPDIPDYFAALYFGLTTLTTVGFGDIAPVTSQGRLIVCGSILAGVAIIPAQAAQLVDAIIGYQREEEKDRSARSGSPARRIAGGGGGAVAVADATDGRGPTGTPIDNPPKEPLDKTPTRKGGGAGERTVPGIVCGNCGAYPHREDASFCWSCGSDLERTEQV